MLTPEQETLAISTAAVTLAVSAFYNIRRKQGVARRWYVASMLLGAGLGVALAWGTSQNPALAFTVGLGAQQLIEPLQRFISKYTGGDKDV